MGLQFSAIEVISMIAITQSLLLAVFFIRLKNTEKSGSKILAMIHIIFAILITSAFFLTRGVNAGQLKIIILSSQVALLTGPLIFFYMNSILKQDFSFNIKDSIHFLPFFILVFYLSIHFYLLNNFIPWRSTVRRFCSGVFLIQFLIYLIFIIIKYRKYRLSQQNDHSKLQKDKQKWLQFILLGYISIWLINMHMFITLDLWNRYGMCPYMYSIFFLCLFIFINLILLTTLGKTNIVVAIKKYNYSPLSEDDKDRYRKRLLLYMEKNKPYRNPALTQNDLAQQLNVTIGYLSQTINESFHLKFNDFINQYRIEESKNLLKESSDGKKIILEIAYKVGFNSKSAFNAAFKKFTGIAPKEYRRIHSLYPQKYNPFKTS